MKKIVLFLCCLACAPALANANPPERWAVYYGSALPAEAFESFDMVVLDSAHLAPVARLKKQGKTVLGYLSLGEAETYRPYFIEIKNRKLLLRPNKLWDGHRMIDIRKKEWAEMVTKTLIPQILAKGFDGIMLDTIDSPLWLETQDPRYAGMTQGAVALLAAIRKEFPGIKIMLNRGFEILPEAAPYIDMSLAESIRADQDPRGGRPKFTDQAQFESQVAILKKAQAVNPQLKIYTLDYWNIRDSQGVAMLYQEQRARHFIPYVSTVDLQAVYPEPK